MIDAFETGFGTISTSVMDLMVVAVPVAVGIAAVIFLSRKAMQWFKGMSKG